MSEESAKAFIKKMREDRAFNQKIAGIKDQPARQAAVKAAGFDFTAAEFGRARGELTDDELDKVAGGASWAHASCWDD
jgi:predicted ribosomally synthesized peptide with nif11-like leader